MPAHPLEPDRDAEQTLLGPVVDVALDLLTRPVGCRGDAGTRGSDLLDLAPDLRLQLLDVEGQANRRPDRRNKPGVIEDRRDRG